MNQLDERIAELIQQDVDGELDAAGKAELEPILRQSAQARQFRQEMQRLATLLAETEDLEPPPGLRMSILDQVELPVKRGAWGGSRFWFKPASYGLAMAAGVLLAVGIDQSRQVGSADLTQVVGSMVARAPAQPSRAAAELLIDAEGVGGRIRLESLENTLAVEVGLESAASLEVTVDLSGSDLSFGGVADLSAQIETLEIVGRNVRIMERGGQPFTLFLQRSGNQHGATQSIGITISQDGRQVYRGAVTAGA